MKSMFLRSFLCTTMKTHSWIGFYARIEAQ